MRISSIVQANLDHFKLNLRYVLVKFIDIHPYENIASIKKILENIPFTYKILENNYSKFELYTIFTIPNHYIDLLNDVASKLVLRNICGEYELVEFNAIKYSYFDFNNWNEEHNNWRSNIESDDYEVQFKNYFEQLFQQYYASSKSNSIKELNKKKRKKLDLYDFSLMRELEFNSRISLKDLVSSYEKDISTLSRKIKYLRQYYIRSYRIYLNLDDFKLHYVMFSGKSHDRVVETISKIISDRKFIYESCFYFNSNNEFYWELKAPKLFITHLFKFLSAFTFDISRFESTYQDETYFRLDPQNFNFDKQEWELKITNFTQYYEGLIQNTLSQLYNQINLNEQNLFFLKPIVSYVDDTENMINAGLKLISSTFKKKRLLNSSLDELTPFSLQNSFKIPDNQTKELVILLLKILQLNPNLSDNEIEYLAFLINIVELIQI